VLAVVHAHPSRRPFAVCQRPKVHVIVKCGEGVAGGPGSLAE
jgi:hypothetical protein